VISEEEVGISELGHANSFRDLLVCKKARAVAKEIFEVTKTFPKEELYSLTHQVRRSSRSSGAQIAEAWAKKRYEKYFISKLTDADGEQLETQHWIEIAGDCGYLFLPVMTRLNSDLDEIGRMLNSMINKANQFCTSNPSPSDH
jgi:four helix bundle protein